MSCLHPATLLPYPYLQGLRPAALRLTLSSGLPFSNCSKRLTCGPNSGQFRCHKSFGSYFLPIFHKIFNWLTETTDGRIMGKRSWRAGMFFLIYFLMQQRFVYIYILFRQGGWEATFEPKANDWLAVQIDIKFDAASVKFLLSAQFIFGIFNWLTEATAGRLMWIRAYQSGIFFYILSLISKDLYIFIYFFGRLGGDGKGITAKDVNVKILRRRP